MKQFGKALTWAWLAAIILALVATYAPSADAAVHAAAQRQNASGDTVQLSLTNGSTFTYATLPAPTFKVVVTLATQESGNRISLATVKLDNGQQFSGDPPTMSSDALTYTWTITASSADGTSQPVEVGSRTAIASFTNPDTSVTTLSNPVSFTVNKASFSLGCGESGTLTHLIKAGQPMQLALSNQSMGTQLPVDWTQGTATITFLGPATVTDANLQPDSSGLITLPAPTTVGRYNLSCSFTGTSIYMPSSITTTMYPLLISEMNQLGSVQLYTNPTTIVANKQIQIELIFHAAPGLPTPTGEYNITIGTSPMYYTSSITIGANGVSEITLSPIFNLYGANQLNVHYFGDGYYNDQIVTFPLTNPAIPGGSTSASSGSSGSKSGATSASATATPQATTTVGSVGDGSSATSATPSSQPATPAPGILSAFGPLSWTNGALWLVALAILLALGAGGGTFYWLSRRRGDATDEPLAQDIVGAPMRPPTGSPLDDVTMPMRRTDRP